MASNHRSIRGRNVNMEEIRNKNATQRALGNANLNARGDLINPQGEIVKHRRDIITDYYSNNQNAVRHVSLKDKINSIPLMTPDEALKNIKNKKIETPTKNEDKKVRKLVDKED